MYRHLILDVSHGLARVPGCLLGFCELAKEWASNQELLTGRSFLVPFIKLVHTHLHTRWAWDGTWDWQSKEFRILKWLTILVGTVRGIDDPCPLS